MNYFLRMLFVFVLLFSFVSPLQTNAFLVPCGNSIFYGITGEHPHATSECTMCDLQILAMNILNWFVLIVVALAALLFVNAGALYMFSPTNPGNISKAHSLFMSALAGLLIVLAAWLIINVVMSALYDNTTFGVWDNMLCETSASASGGGSSGGGSTQGGDATADSRTGTNGNTYTDSGARNLLSNAGIGVNKTIDEGTSLEGIRQDTLDGVIEMNEWARAHHYFPQGQEGMVITGGTEDGHSTNGTMTHGNGYKLDLRTNTGTNNYIENEFTPDGVRGGAHGGARYVKELSSGIVVTAVREGDHWDLTFSRG